LFLSDHGEALGEQARPSTGVPVIARRCRSLFSSSCRRVFGGDPQSHAGRADRRLSRPSSGPWGRRSSGGASRNDLARGPFGRRRRVSSSGFLRRRSSLAFHFGWSGCRRSWMADGTTSRARRPEITIWTRTEARRTEPRRRRPDPLRALRKELLDRRPAYQSRGVDPDARRKLSRPSAISARARRPASGALDDPKDRIATSRSFERGLGEMTGGGSTRPTRSFHEAFSPRTRRHARRLGHGFAGSHVPRQKPEESLAALRRPVELAPEIARVPLPHRGCEHVSTSSESIERRERHAEAIARFHDPAPMTYTARAALGRGDIPTAERPRMRRSRRERSRRAYGPRLVSGDRGSKRRPRLRARVRRSRADLSKGEQQTTVGPSRLRGDVLARSGRIPEARGGVPGGDATLSGFARRLDLARPPSTVADRRKVHGGSPVELGPGQPTPEVFLMCIGMFHRTEDPKGESELVKEARRDFPETSASRRRRSRSAVRRRPPQRSVVSIR